jgi:hypothetical protein
MTIFDPASGQAAEVASTDRGTPAGKIGLMPGDLIFQFGKYSATEVLATPYLLREVGREEQGDECGGGCGKRPLKNRHLDDETAHSFGGLGGHHEADIATEGDPADHGFLDAEVIEQGDDVSGVGVHPVVRGPTWSI